MMTRRHEPIALILIVMFALLGGTVEVEAQYIKVTVEEGSLPTLDGTIEVDEWADGDALALDDTKTVFIKSCDRCLYVGYSGFPDESFGYACLFLHIGSRIYVLHASSQLGTGIYNYNAESRYWIPTSAKYPWAATEKIWPLQGWRATTDEEGLKGQQEFVVNLDHFFPDVHPDKPVECWIALGYIHGASKTLEAITWPVDLTDDTCHKRLLSGSNPLKAHFNPAEWAALVINNH